MQFAFHDGNGGPGGYLAFTPVPTTTSEDTTVHPGPLLLVTDAGHDAVHLVDVVGRTHAGYLASPGSIPGPRGVAASGTSDCTLVAISAWKEWDGGDQVVWLYRGSGAVWEAVRVMDVARRRFANWGPQPGELARPRGLRFSRDGSSICVSDSRNYAIVLRVTDGEFLRHLATGAGVGHDVEEVEGGWLVACSSTLTMRLIEPDVDDGVPPVLGRDGGGRCSGDEGAFIPVCLAVVPGLGLVVRNHGNYDLLVFATPDTIAMAAMSPARVAWMGAVARGMLLQSRQREHLAGAKGGPGPWV
jgi:hypothetical protein